MQKVAPDQTTNRSFPFSFLFCPSFAVTPFLFSSFPLPFLFFSFSISFPFLFLSSSFPFLFFSSSFLFLFLFPFPLPFLFFSFPLSFLFFSSSQSFSFPFPFPSPFSFPFPFPFPFPFFFRLFLASFCKTMGTVAIGPLQKRHPIFGNQAKTISFDKTSHMPAICCGDPTLRTSDVELRPNIDSTTL